MHNIKEILAKSYQNLIRSHFDDLNAKLDKGMRK